VRRLSSHLLAKFSLPYGKMLGNGKKSLGVKHVFWQQLVNGLTLGSTYSLVALGYTLIMGVLDIVNMAHGEVFMFGAFVGLILVADLHLNIFVAMLGAAIASSLLGIIMERVALRPLRRRSGSGVSHLAPLISTIGVSIFLESLALKLFGPQTQAFPKTFSNTIYTIGPMKISLVQVVILAVSFGLMLVLRFWLAKTKIGKALRATAESIETAGILGVNTNLIIVLTVSLASGLGGIAGVLVGLTFNAVEPTMGISMGLKGLAVLILGGMGNITGAMFGGLVLGVAEVFSVAYGASSYRDAVAFGMIIIILFLRPQGLFGAKDQAGGR
jgi:branched-chain amino acid transport system permease protein